MSEGIYEFLSIVMAILLAGVLIAAASSFGGAGRQLNAQVNATTETREVLKEYRKYNAYDDKEVSGALAISLILELQGGDVGVEIQPASAPGGATQYVGYLDGSKQFVFLNDATNDKFKPENLQINIIPTAKYMATLAYTSNDSVGVVKFSKIP